MAAVALRDNEICHHKNHPHDEAKALLTYFETHVDDSCDDKFHYHVMQLQPSFTDEINYCYVKELLPLLFPAYIKKECDKFYGR
jgi:hypothetical protein